MNRSHDSGLPMDVSPLLKQTMHEALLISAVLYHMRFEIGYGAETAEVALQATIAAF